MPAHNKYDDNWALLMEKIFKLFTAKYENKIIADRYENFDQYNLVFEHKTFTPKKIRILLSKSYTMYYGRLTWIFKYIKNSFLA